jgi:hypothetical protein
MGFPEPSGETACHFARKSELAALGDDCVSAAVTCASNSSSVNDLSWSVMDFDKSGQAYAGTQQRDSNAKVKLAYWEKSTR